MLRTHGVKEAFSEKNRIWRLFETKYPQQIEMYDLLQVCA